MLHNLGCLRYSPLLDGHIRDQKVIPSGSTWEIEIRGTSIWCVEMIRKEILKQNPEIRGGSALETPQAADSVAGHVEGDLGAEPDSELNKDTHFDGINEHGNGSIGEPNGKYNDKGDNPMVNAILIDFFLYDTMKEREEEGKVDMPHHRTRSIWY